MAMWDQGGGCSCGTRKVCNCDAKSQADGENWQRAYDREYGKVPLVSDNGSRIQFKEFDWHDMKEIWRTGKVVRFDNKTQKFEIHRVAHIDGCDDIFFVNMGWMEKNTINR